MGMSDSRSSSPERPLLALASWSLRFDVAEPQTPKSLERRRIVCCPIAAWPKTFGDPGASADGLPAHSLDSADRRERMHGLAWSRSHDDVLVNRPFARELATVGKRECLTFPQQTSENEPR